jgi:hypothetical protein
MVIANSEVDGDAQVHPRRPSIMCVHAGSYVIGDGNVTEGHMLYFLRCERSRRGCTCVSIMCVHTV